MAKKNPPPKTEAEVKIAKAAARASDAAAAWRDAEDEARRVEANTARLRALRLARDAAAAKEGAKTKKKKSKAAAKSIPVDKLNASNDE